jgi:hypothetical protein
VPASHEGPDPNGDPPEEARLRFPARRSQEVRIDRQGFSEGWVEDDGAWIFGLMIASFSGALVGATIVVLIWWLT